MFLHNILVCISILLAAATLPGTIELFLVTLGYLLPVKRPILPQKSKRALFTFSTGKVNKASKRALHFAVVIPAHNEEIDIAQTIKSLKTASAKVEFCDVIVLADNCRDHTEKYALEAGAIVLSRFDLMRKGKGYALEYAFKELLKKEYDIFSVVDADTLVDSNYLAVLHDLFESGVEAAQTRYEVLNVHASIRTRLMEIAFLAFNVIRPKGRQYWGLSAGIFGNGFAISRQTLLDVPYRAYSIVEDLEYHLCLVKAGKCVYFADQTAVRSSMPSTGSTAKTQRTRWESGRLNLMIKAAPDLVQAIFLGRWKLIEPLLELLLLPLTYHMSLLLVLVAMPIVSMRIYALAAIGVVVLHALAACSVSQDGLKSIWVLLTAPAYLLWKLGTLFKNALFSKGRPAWIRTDRKK